MDRQVTDASVAKDLRSKVRFTIGASDPKSQNTVLIYDEDFHWDGMLEVTGDFGDRADARRYAQSICDALNAAEIPHE